MYTIAIFRVVGDPGASPSNQNRPDFPPLFFLKRWTMQLYALCLQKSS